MKTIPGWTIVAALAFMVAARVIWAQNSGDPVIEKARQTAAAYGQSLPDYIVKRTTTRHLDYHQVQASKTLDTVTADVAAEHGKEIYTNIQVNGAPVKTLPSGGAWSAGEFADEMMMILDPKSAAQFTHQHAESIRNHPALRYDYAIDKAHSTWHLSAANLGGTRAEVDYVPAYAGKIWIDRESGQAIGIEMSARGLPSGFPLVSVDSHTDYDFVKIGEARYLLPVHSETVSCETAGTVCLRNETDFQNYDKFTANSNITFDGGGK